MEDTYGCRGYCVTGRFESLGMPELGQSKKAADRRTSIWGLLSVDVEDCGYTIGFEKLHRF